LLKNVRLFHVSLT